MPITKVIYGRTAAPGERQRNDNGKMVGRRGELAQLEAALSGLTAGTGEILEVSGDPGFGKTRLLAEICARARKRKLPVLASRADPGGGSSAFRLFAEALDDHLTRWTERQELPPDLLELLAPVLPAVRPRGAMLWVGQSSTDQPEIIWALRRLLCLLAADGMVLALDDVHLADSQSLVMLDSLVRHPIPVPLLVAVAHRPRQAALRLRSMLAASTEHGSGRKITAGPLSLSETAELLGPRVSEGRLESVHHDTGGNPRYLLTLAWHDEGVVRAAPAGKAESAAQLEVLLPTELDGLSATEMAVLAAAAVLGQHFRFDGLVKVSGLDSVRASAGLDMLLHRDLIRPLAGPLLSLRDPLIAQAIYTLVHPIWRVEAHQRALTWATDNGGTVIQRARHAACSAGSWTPEMHAVLYGAAAACLYTSPGESANWLRVILELLPSTDASEEYRAETTLLLATALGLMGQFDRSRDLLHALLVSGPAGSGQAQLAAIIVCARMERMLGRHSEAAALLRREVGHLAGDDSTLVAGLCVEAAAAAIGTGNLPAAQEHAACAVRSARFTGQDPVLAASLAVLVLTQACGTEPADGGNVDEVAAIVDGMFDQDLLPHIETLDRLGWAELLLERFPAAERHLRRGELIARHAGHRYPLASLALGLSRVYLAWGPLDAAAHWADQAQRNARETGRQDMAALATAIRAVALSGGQAENAPAQLEAGGVPFPWPCSADSWLTQETVSALASAAARPQTGDVNPRLPAAATAATNFVLLPAAARTRHFEWRTRAALAEGDLASAQAHLAGAALAAENGGLPGQRGYWLRAQAAVLSAQSHHREAERTLADSARCFAEAGLRFDQARTDLTRAVTLRSLGHPAEAVKAAERAASTAARIGARQVQTAADQLRASLRVQPRHPAGDIFAMLTERESEIAQLVGSGHTSRHVAQYLHLSTRTVETHLSRIYRKLNLSSRSALARLVEREAHGATRLLGG